MEGSGAGHRLGAGTPRHRGPPQTNRHRRMDAFRASGTSSGARPDAPLRLVPLRGEEARLRPQPGRELPPAERRYHVANQLAGRHQPQGRGQLLRHDGELSLFPERHVKEQRSLSAEQGRHGFGAGFGTCVAVSEEQQTVTEMKIRSYII